MTLLSLTPVNSLVFQVGGRPAAVIAFSQCLKGIVSRSEEEILREGGAVPKNLRRDANVVLKMSLMRAWMHSSAQIHGLRRSRVNLSSMHMGHTLRCATGLLCILFSGVVTVFAVFFIAILINPLYVQGETMQ